MPGFFTFKFNVMRKKVIESLNFKILQYAELIKEYELNPNAELEKNMIEVNAQINLLRFLLS